MSAIDKNSAYILCKGCRHHHPQCENSKELVDKLKDLVVPPGQKLVSYDVTALSTSTN